MPLTPDQLPDDIIELKRRLIAKDAELLARSSELAIKVSDSKTANRSFLLAPDGSIRARYSKIHLFDVDLPGGATIRWTRMASPFSMNVFTAADVCRSKMSALAPSRVSRNSRW